jgi:hypothetical protein
MRHQLLNFEGGDAMGQAISQMAANCSPRVEGRVLEVETNQKSGQWSPPCGTLRHQGRSWEGRRAPCSRSLVGLRGSE